MKCLLETVFSTKGEWIVIIMSFHSPGRMKFSEAISLFLRDSKDSEDDTN